MRLATRSSAPRGTRPRQQLVRLLQLAYSGELGAALAYRGHAASVADPSERHRISQIREEELDHRQRVGRMLRSLDGQPDPLLECRNRCIGSGIALFCHVGGWFLPMYGAGWIELRNIREYEHAARLAARCGEADFAEQLLALAEVEWEHECYFRLKAASHPFSRWLKVWPAPPPKDEIRRAFRVRDRFDACALGVAVSATSPDTASGSSRWGVEG
jgi:rubrerythrin